MKKSPICVFIVLCVNDLKNFYNFSVWMLKRINFLKVFVITFVSIIEVLLMYGLYKGRHIVPMLNILVGMALIFIIGSISISLLNGLRK